MKVSEIIKKKLANEPNRKAIIKQLNGGVTDLYFVTNNTFWSGNLNKLIKNGYSFEVFDIFYEEAIKNKDKRLKKGGARNSKLGYDKCTKDTMVGIFGYKYLKANTGESILDPIHVFSAILEYSGVAKNRRGYIEFL